MPYDLKSLVPNLVVPDVERSVAFYRDVLGFTLEQSVPDAAPYVFASVKRNGVRVFLNALDAAAAEYSAFKDRPIGGTLTLFVDVSDIHAAYASLKDRVTMVLPLERKWYGVTEFAFADPDGYLVTYAQHDDMSEASA
jgi:catechol 2,3-dioxygenase-like lactoylglutathione lyase family enzyme